MRTFSRSLLAAALGIACSTIFLPSALANLSVRNDTPDQIWVSVAYSRNNAWYSSGWYAATPGQTTVLLNGDLNQQYYYLYAFDNRNNVWGGSYYFCTMPRQAFDGLPFNPSCVDPGHEQKGFFLVDTQNRPDHVQVLSLNAAAAQPGQPSPSPTQPPTPTAETGNCRIMGDLSDASAQLLERFVDVALPQILQRSAPVSVGNGATVQFQVRRNGPITVRTSAKGVRFGALAIDVPLKFTDIRADYYEGNRARQAPSDNIAVMVHSTIEFTTLDNTLNSLVTNAYTWDHQPTITILNRSVNLLEYARTNVNSALIEAHQQWLGAIDPLLRNFSNNRCTWKTAASRTTSFIGGYSVNQVSGQKLQEAVKARLEQELRY